MGNPKTEYSVDQKTKDAVVKTGRRYTPEESQKSVEVATLNRTRAEKGQYRELSY